MISNIIKELVGGTLSDIVKHIIDNGLPNPPGAPENVVAIDGGGGNDNSIDVTWTAASGDVTGYIVQHKPDTSGTWISNNVGVTFSFNIPGLTSGITYDVRVIALNGMLQGPPSLEDQASVTGVPGQPEDLLITPQPYAVDATWATPPSDPGVTSYDFEYKLNSDITWTVVNTALTNLSISGLDTDLYNFRVKAINSVGGSIYSDIINATPNGLSASTPVIWNEDGVDQVNPVTFVNNTGSGGSSYNLNTVVGTGANLTAQVRNGKPCFQSSGAAALRTASPPPGISPPYSFVSAFLPFFVDGTERFIWNGSFDTATMRITSTDHRLFSGSSLTNPVNGALTDTIVFGVVNGASSRLRVVVKGGSDTTVFGNAGTNNIQPEILLWNFSQTGSQDFPAQVFENRFIAGDLSSAEEQGLIDLMANKWFL